MRFYYHSTSWQNALQIMKTGFRKGDKGMFGPGMYFAEKPEGAMQKSHDPVKDAIIVVTLNVGRLKTERYAHNNWDLNIINKLGYDTVEMRHCRTGPEICVYESHRIKIICVVHITQNKIEFNEIANLNIDIAEFSSIINNKKVSINKGLNQTNGNFPQDFRFVNYSQMYNGILNYIRNTNMNLVDITTSSIYPHDKNNYLQNLVNYNDNKSSFCTNDLPDQWICFDFKNRNVIPNFYTIRTFDLRPGVSHLRSWVIEGSNDNSYWTVIDQQNNCTHLNGPRHVYNFSIDNPNNDSYRYLRIRQTGTNWRNRNYLKLNCIEFYGIIN